MLYNSIHSEKKGFLIIFNPVLKFFALIIGIIIVLIDSNIYSQIKLLFFFFVFISLIIFLNKINIADYLLTLIKISLFLLIISILFPLFNNFNESVIYLNYPVVIGKKKVFFMSTIFLKSFLSVVQILIFQLTTSLGDFIYILNSIRFPKILRDMLILVIKYFFIIENEMNKMKKSLVLRGFKNKDLRDVKFVGNMFSNLFIRTISKGENLLKSMELRGYEFYGSNSVFNFNIINIIVLILYFIVLVLIKFCV